VNPVTHALLGWAIAGPSGGLSRRERAWIVAAAVAPDLDGLGLIAEIATRESREPLYWWSEYHHRLGHNLGACLLVTALAAVALRRFWPVLLVAVSFHLHLLGDLVGARGPDGYQWPIPYLLPFSSRPELTVPWQWELNAWPNVVISVGLLAFTFWLAWRTGRSPLELVSRRANLAFVKTLRTRWPRV
jgi:hypothetical protein